MLDDGGDEESEGKRVETRHELVMCFGVSVCHSWVWQGRAMRAGVILGWMGDACRSSHNLDQLAILLFDGVRTTNEGGCRGVL